MDFAHAFSCFATDSTSGIPGLKGKCICAFARSSQTVHHRGCAILLPYQQFMRKCFHAACVCNALDICPSGEQDAVSVAGL